MNVGRLARWLAPGWFVLLVGCADDDSPAGSVGAGGAGQAGASAQGGAGQAGAGQAGTAGQGGSGAGQAGSGGAGQAGSGGAGQAGSGGAGQAGSGGAGQAGGGGAGQAGAGQGGAAPGGSGGGAGSGGGGGTTVGTARRLGLEINPPDPANSYSLALDVAQAIGVSVVPLALPWPLLEEAPGPDGAPSYAPMKDLVASINGAFSSRPLGLLLSLPAVDTVSYLVPPDLADALASGQRRWNDPVVIGRYNALLDELLGQLAPTIEVVAVLVGNEIDVNLASKPATTAADYLTFVEQTTAHARQLRPLARVGVNLTYAGLVGPQAASWQPFLAASDATFVSYYASGNLGGGESSLAPDIDALLALDATRPLVFKEYGYATGKTGSSPAGQVPFVDAMFATWDAHAARIPLWVYSRFYDGDPVACAQEAVSYGFPGDKEFEAFLCTLGLYTFANQPKPAWTTFSQRAAALVP